MPKFLEEKLKKRYGKDSGVPYAIMNKLGFMHGSKVTEKGRAAEKKHMDKITQHNQHRPKRHVKSGGKKNNPNRYQPTGLIRGLGGERHRAAERSKKSGKGPTFAEAMNR